jgi:hypothetical protein
MSYCGLVSSKNGEFQEVKVLYEHLGLRKSAIPSCVVQGKAPLFTHLPTGGLLGNLVLACGVSRGYALTV